MNDIKFKITVSEDMTEEQKDELANRVAGSLGMMLNLHVQRFRDEENEDLYAQNAELRRLYDEVAAERETLYTAIDNIQALSGVIGKTEPSKLATAQIVFEQE